MKHLILKIFKNALFISIGSILLIGGACGFILALYSIGLIMDFNFILGAIVYLLGFGFLFTLTEMNELD